MVSKARTLSASGRHAAPAGFRGAVRVGPRGEIIIPPRLRRELGIKPGEQVLILKAGGSGGFVVQQVRRLLADAMPAVEPPTLQHQHGARRRGGATDRPDLAQELAALELFAGLAPDVLGRIAALVRIRRYAAGAFVAREGEPCESLYVVRSGLIRYFKTSSDGKEQVLKFLGPGESLDEAPAVDGGPSPATAQAVEQSELYTLHRADLSALLGSDPTVAVALTRTLAGRERHLIAVIEDLSFRPVIGRVARLLLDQARGRVPARRISQQEMAAMVGTTREVAGRALHRLEAAGAIRLERGGVVIQDQAGLAAYI